MDDNSSSVSEESNDPVLWFYKRLPPNVEDSEQGSVDGSDDGSEEAPEDADANSESSCEEDATFSKEDTEAILAYLSENAATVTEVVFRGNWEGLPNWIGQLTGAVRVDCDATGLTTLSPMIGRLAALRTLLCSHNPLRHIPGAIGNCRALEAIDFSDCELRSLPATISRCPLYSVLLYNNQFPTFPRALLDCLRIGQLDLNSCEIDAIPEGIGRLTQLADFNIAFNRVDDIPRTLRRCPLKTFSCIGNRIPEARLAELRPWLESWIEDAEVVD